MNKRVFLIAFLLLIGGGTPLWAQGQYISGSIGNADNGATQCSTTGGFVSIPTGTSATVAFSVSGTSSQTLQFVTTVDGTNFSTATAFPPNSTTGVTSTTSAGTWTVAVPAMAYFCVRSSAYTSGSFTVNMRNSIYVSASTLVSGGGGGGAGWATAVSCSTVDAFVYWLSTTTGACDPGITTNTSGILSVTGGVTTGASPPLAVAAGVTGGFACANGTTAFTPTVGQSGIRCATGGIFATLDNGSETRFGAVLPSAGVTGHMWTWCTANAWAVCDGGVPVNAAAAVTFSVAGAASTPAVSITGTPFVGTGTTSTPQLYCNGGTAPTTWNSSASGGTYIGCNAITGFAGNFLDFHVNGGTSIFLVSSNGSITTGASATITTNTIQPSVIRNNATARVMFTSTIPTIAAGGCGGAAAAIGANPSGTEAFQVNVGTTNTGTCTVTMPAAAVGWMCHADDITTTSTTVFYTKQTGALATTSITLKNFSDVASNVAWTDSDILNVICWAE